MKRTTFIASLFLLSVASTGVSASAAGNPVEVETLGHATRYNYRPNEVIVKFKDTSRARIAPSSGAAVRSGVRAVDDAFGALGVSRVEELMPLTGAETFARRLKSYSGQDVAAPSLANARLIEIDPSKSVEEAVSLLKEVPDVEYAEPNYMVYSLGDESDINDPYYSVQYGIQAINLFNLWGQPVINKDGPVIAIIDTGVDISHPDLQANIWTNPAESSGATGYDDDRNGYVDDLHGWDFVNQTGMIADYNGHGTHCAGIAAAVGRNGLGIIGANPNARIMPLTAMQSNGQGDVATIIKAIDYATANGAQVISMSLGTYSQSSALEQALGRAYQKAVIVAAAGNDGYCLNHPHPEKGQSSAMPMYPAALPYVLGVQAAGSNGARAAFSNYDDDGAVFSAYSEDKLYNYELTVPGVGITSTYPNGQYKALNGTSMATPLVAGAVSRLLQSKQYDNKEELFGDLINTVQTNGIMDIYAAYLSSDANRTPSLQIIGNRLADADGDGRADAGEIIEFYPMIRNGWGTAGNIRLTLDCAEEANTFCEFLETEAEFGQSLSSYGKAESKNPLRIRINDNTVDGRVCRLKLTAKCDNAPAVTQEFEIKVENGVELGGILREDMTLHADQHYIVTSLFGVPAGVTLTIEPGTVIKFKDNTGITVSGNLVAVGEPGKMITFTKADLDQGYVTAFKLERDTIEYCIIENLYNNENLSYSNFIFNAKNSIYRSCSFSYTIYKHSFFNSNIYDLNAKTGIHNSGRIHECNITKNQQKSNPGYFLKASSISSSNVFSNYFGEEVLSIGYVNNYSSYTYTPEEPNYLGTADYQIARNHVFDIYHPLSGSFGELDLSNMLTRPVAEAHGIVWKVVVDGYDAQDEYDLLPPLGVGRHKFDVYFNRPMNKDKAPVIAMGVRAPYTQNAIAEDGSWNSEGDVYTAWFTLTGKQNIDGVNRIYVAEAEDNEFFEIPVEDLRFNVNVQCAGSLSTGFFAEAGLGRVNLTWEDLDMNFDDIMGYNMYRISPDSGEAVQINDRLIDAGTTTYTDYDVTPGKTYQYYYKVMTTGLKENDPSKIVAVTPLTATLGDANGSGNVDVADVLTTVNYASGMNPRPFIFEAADINTDTNIDILDVVGIVNVIMGSHDNSMLMAVSETTLWITDGILYIDTPVDLAGLQFDFTFADDRTPIEVLESLDGFEITGSWQSDNVYRIMAYNLNGKTIAPGIHPLLRVGDATLTDIRISDRSGSNVEPVFAPHSGIDVIDKDNLKVVNSRTGVYDMMGVKVGDRMDDLNRLAPGVYIVNGWKVIKK